jgi:hypothetical protein
MRNLMRVCAGLAILAGVSWSLWHERADREQSNQLPVRSAAIPESTATPVPSVSPALPPPPPARMPSPPRQSDDGTATASLTRFLAADAARLQAQVKDPEYRQARFARQRLLLPQEYPGLVERLGLAPEEADRLFDLLTGVQMEKLDANAGNAFIPGQPGDVAAVQELMRLRQQIQRRREESLVALLGSARYGQFMAYEEERPARQRVDALGRTLASLGQPLSEAQAGPLTAVFLAEQKQQQEPAAMRGGEADIERQAQRNRRLLEAVQPHLDARQIETYTTILDQQLAQSRAALRLQREQSEVPGR